MGIPWIIQIYGVPLQPTNLKIGINMNNAESTKMTFVKETNHGNQLVFEDYLGNRYKMSTKHFQSNMNSRSRSLYTGTDGLPIEGMEYSVLLYSDTGRIALDRNEYLWERSYTSCSHSTTTGEAVGNLIFSAFKFGLAVWEYLKDDSSDNTKTKK